MARPRVQCPACGQEVYVDVRMMPWRYDAHDDGGSPCAKSRGIVGV